MNKFEVCDLSPIGLKVIKREKNGDRRGFLTRMFCADELRAAGWITPVAQINFTHTSKKGSIRGMHLQRPPYDEMKLVSCINGEIWDVAVDMRVGSPTYLAWYSQVLSRENNLSFLIPSGFAHGFQALSDNAELIYCHSAPYSSLMEMGVAFNDPALDISWPLRVTEISDRDKAYPFIDDKFLGV